MDLSLIKSQKDKVTSTKASKRLISLFDEGSFYEIDSLVLSPECANVAVGFGTINGCPVYAFSQDSSLKATSIGKLQIDKIVKIYKLAAKTGTPVIGIYDSKGATLKEGTEVLNAYSEMLYWTNNLSGVVPQISVIAGACTGTLSVIAQSADFVIKAKEASFYLNLKDKNNIDSEESELVHIITETPQAAIETAKKIISYLPSNNLEMPMFFNAVGSSNDKHDFVSLVADNESTIELLSKFGTDAKIFFAKVAGQTAGIINASSKTELSKNAMSKTARFVRFCDAFSIPVITGIDIESLSCMKEAAKVTQAYAEATTAKITVITGNAVGSAFIAFASKASNSDIILSWPNAVISALKPETAVAVMWDSKLKKMINPSTDRPKIIEQYKTEEASPLKAAQNGLLDDIILPEDTRSAVINALNMLAGKRETKLPKKHSNIQL